MRNYWFTAVTDDGQDEVIVYARNKWLVSVMLNDDVGRVEQISAKEAKRLIKKGFRVVK